MSFKTYLISKDFWKNILFTVLITVLMVLLTMLGIRVYTNHGKSFAIPDFSGMDMKHVIAEMELKELHYEIIDSLYLKDAKPGSIVDQVPSPGSLVKEGRTIFLTICALNPEQVAMPKLTDISYRQAINVMHSFGLNTGDITYVPSEFPNLVLKQQLNGEEIRVGLLINKGSYIDLVVGEGQTGAKTFLPNLLGVTLEQAKLVIAESNLNTGAIIYDDSFSSLDDSLDARIWQQRPEPGENVQITQGSQIDLWLTIDVDKLN